MAMENYDLLIQNLSEYTPDEQFYREYYYIKQANDPELMAHFTAKYSVDEVKARKLICPEIYDSSPAFFEEKHFKMDSAHNIMLQKHNRYTPVYMHSHEFFELFYILRGSCDHYTANDKKTLTQGALCFLSPNIKHGIGVFDDSIVLNLFIQKSTFDDMFFNIIRSKNVLSEFFISSVAAHPAISYLTFQIDDEELEHLLLSMLLEEMVEDEYTNRVLNSLISVFFTKLTRKYGCTAVVHQVSGQLNQTELAMLACINDHYKDITLSELAKQFNYSQEHCSRLIKNATGQSFTHLLRDIRLRRAEALLLNTALSIEDISYLIGYENPSSFIKLFHVKYDMTPGQFRQIHAG